MASLLVEVPADAFWCSPLGSADQLECCTLESVSNSNSSCGMNVWVDDPETNPCSTGDCLSDCQNFDLLYKLDTGFDTTGSLMNMHLYSLCVSIPNIYAYLNQGYIPSDYTEYATKFLPPLNHGDLVNITNSVTHCLMSTCDQARDSTSCTQLCSPATLLVDSGTPSIRGISDCLRALCQTDSSLSITSSLPYANSDIAGIGVYTSYYAQCGLAIIVCMILAFIEWKSLSKQSTATSKHLRQQKERLVTGIVEFHKAQCFFSIPIMVASLFTGIFQENALNVFTILPLALNSIAPLQLILLLITHFGHFSNFLVFLTAVSWALASIVYWTLYRQLPSNATWAYENGQAFRNQLVLDLASTPTCGGYSALSVCPNIWSSLGVADNTTARAQTALIFSPWIWTWYTVCLAGVIVKHWAKSGVSKYPLLASISHSLRRSRLHEFIKPITQHLTGIRIFWFMSTVCVALISVQLYYLSLAFTLSLVDARDWSFGQIIAVTVWIPPIVEYIQLQINGVISGSKYRFAKNLALFRIQKPQPDSQEAQRRGSGEVHSDILDADGLSHKSEPSPTEGHSQQTLTNLPRGIGATGTSATCDSNLGDEGSETFQLRTRSTLRMEEGSGNTTGELRS